MQGMEFHFYAGQYGPTAVGAGGIEVVNGDAGSGIDDDAVGAGKERPSPTGRSDAVGTEGLGCGVVEGDGQGRIRSEAVDGAPGVEEGAEVGLARGANSGTAPGETVDKGYKLWGVGDSLVGETRPVEECPLNACIAYVESQIHLL